MSAFSGEAAGAGGYFRAGRYFARLCLLQGAYYLITGLWPLLSIETFMAATGPKIDLWLVKTVGLMLMASGAAMLLAGARGRVSLEVGLLAVGNALGLALVEVVCVGWADFSCLSGGRRGGDGIDRGLGQGGYATLTGTGAEQKHLTRSPKIETICLDAGYEPAIICTPGELMEPYYENYDD